MKKKRVIQDLRGLLIKFLICAILWYKDLIQVYLPMGPMFLLLGVLLTAVVLFDNYSAKGQHSLEKLPKASYLVFLYVLLSFMFGLIVTPNRSSFLSNGFTVVEFMVIMMYVCYYARTRGSLDFLLWNAIVLYFVICVFFLVAPVTVLEKGVKRYSISESVNPNSLSMNMAIGVWATLFMISSKKLHPALGLPICGAMAYACVMTASRKGFIGLAIAIVLWTLFVFLPSDDPKNVRKKVIRLLIVLAVVAVAIRLLLPVLEKTAVFTRFEGMGEDSSTRVRRNMYSVGLEYLKASPIFGYGFWGFQHFYGVYSHSTWVEVFVSSGIPLALLYFSSYLVILWGLIHRYLFNRKNSMSNTSAKMYMILFTMEMFYTVCIIHIYNLTSFVLFGLLIMAADRKQDRNLPAVPGEAQT